MRFSNQFTLSLGVRNSDPLVQLNPQKMCFSTKQFKSRGPKFGPLVQLNPQKMRFSNQFTLSLGVRNSDPLVQLNPQKMCFSTKQFKSRGPKFGPLVQLNPQKMRFSKQFTLSLGVRNSDPCFD